MVTIPIQADVSAIQGSLEQLRSAIEKSGQAAKALKDIDLSHPELAKFAADLDVVRQRFEQLAQTQGATARAARQFIPPGGGGVTFWNLFGPEGFFGGGLNRLYPNPQTAERIRAQAGNYVLQGAPNLQPPAPSQPPQPPPPPPAGLGAMLAGAWSMTPSAMSVLGPVLAIAGIGSLGVMAARALQMAQQEGVAIDTLMRRINDSGQDFDRFRAAITESAKGLGITNIEAARLATTWSRMTAENDPNAVAGGARFAAGFGRAYGVEPEAAAASLGRAEFLGIPGKQFALMIGEAVARGNQTGQQEQVNASLLQGLEKIAQAVVTGTAIQGAFSGYADLYTALNASGQPGLRGVNAAGILDTMNQTLMQGGGAGMASQLFSMRAFANEGILDPYEVEGRLKKGMFSEIREGGPTVLGVELAELNREYGDRARSNPWRYRHIVERQLGIRMPVVEALQGVFGPNLTGMTATGTGLGETSRRLEAAGIDINSPQFNASAIQDLIGIASGVGRKGQNLEGYRTRMLGRAGITDEEKARLQGATGTGLQDVLLQMYAKYGQEPTEGQQTRLAMANLQSALTELGRVGIGPLTGVIVVLTDVLKTISSALDALSNFLGAKGPLAQFAVPPDAFGGESTLDKPENADPGFPGFGFLGKIGRGIKSMFTPGPLPLPTGEQSSRIREAVAKLQQPEYGGWTRAEAIAITEQAKAESGMNEKAVNSGGYAGLFQLSAERQAYIEKYYHKPFKSLTFDQQLNIPNIEMGPGGPKEEQGGYFRRNFANDVGGGSNYLTKAYESPDLWWLRAPYRSQDAMRMEIDDLTVIHKDSRGRIMGTETLPTFVIPPTPNNAPSGPLSTAPSSGTPAPAATPSKAPKITIPDSPIEMPSVLDLTQIPRDTLHYLEQPPYS